ncbi:MAG: cytochrome c-type biogenesis protein CcmH [Acidimicrobiales bacterium]|nr:cytochrome c-type biogenesis protein CcmH [Acidimicrobiales bacterium]
MTGAKTGTKTGTKSGPAKWIAWVAMLVVIVVALFVGTVGQPSPTEAERAQNLAETIRCPSCKSQAVASSETPASKAVRELIWERIEAGDTDEEIRDYVASRFPGQDLLLDPEGSGFSGLVWALPVVFVIAAVAGLVMRFAGYRAQPLTASQEDKSLVDAALRASENGEKP